MKKVFFVSLMLVALGGISYSQTAPVKASSTQKKEAAKPVSSISSATPVKNTKSNAEVTKTTKPSTKPAATSVVSNQSAGQIGKHKKVRHATKSKNKSS